MPRYVVAYDISGDSRRRNVADFLDSIGDRVQNSVFELVVSQSMLDQCLRRISELVDVTEDTVAIYFLCGTCESKRVYLGLSNGIANIGDEHVFVV